MNDAEFIADARRRTPTARRNTGTGKLLEEALQRLAQQQAEVERLVVARPLEEWHEDYGPALFWFFPIVEPPFVGTPNDSDWVHDCYTHWTPIPMPTLAAAERKVEEIRAAKDDYDKRWTQEDPTASLFTARIEAALTPPDAEEADDPTSKGIQR